MLAVYFGTPKGQRLKLSSFRGSLRSDEADGNPEHETIHIHFNDGSVLDFDDLQRAVIRDRRYEPVSPDWFIEEVKPIIEARVRRDKEASEASERKAESGGRTRQQCAFTAEIKARIAPSRPVEYLTDPELFAKVSGAPVSIAEEIMIAYEGNLARMAGSTAKQMQKIKGIGRARSEKIIAAFEIGKRLARFHAEQEKITAPSDVADLMMSKMRYLQKEIVCVLCLDTKGQVTTTGTAGELASDLKWGKMLAESTVFEGTLNSTVFHPREIFRFAIEASANSIVLVHNHPSGDPQPSQEDVRATKQLIEAGNHIGIKVLDHVVIGDGIFVSLKEEGFI